MGVGAHLQKYLAEFMGNFYLVATIVLVTSSSVGGGVILAPLGVGFVLLALIFAMGHVSSAHYNPAVTLVMALRGETHPIDAASYVGCQVGGSLLGAVVSGLLTPDTSIGAPDVTGKGGKDVARAFGAEVVFTSLLVLVILHVAASKQKHNGFYGIAIAFTVTAGAIATGPISGAVFNPAVGSGLIVGRCVLGKCDALVSLWLYWVAPCLGAGIGAVLYFLMTYGDLMPPPPASSNSGGGSCGGPSCDSSEAVCLRTYDDRSTEPGSDAAEGERTCLRARVCRGGSSNADN